MKAYPPEFDGLEVCDICDRRMKDCDCPACPTCGTTGDKDCEIHWPEGVPMYPKGLNLADLQAAERVLDRQYQSAQQWARDLKIACDKGLVTQDLDVDGPYLAPTWRYIWLGDDLDPIPAQ